MALLNDLAVTLWVNGNLGVWDGIAFPFTKQLVLELNSRGNQELCFNSRVLDFTKPPFEHGLFSTHSMNGHIHMIKVGSFNLLKFNVDIALDSLLETVGFPLLSTHLELYVPNKRILLFKHKPSVKRLHCLATGQCEKLNCFFSCCSILK